MKFAIVFCDLPISIEALAMPASDLVRAFSIGVIGGSDYGF